MSYILGKLSTSVAECDLGAMPVDQARQASLHNFYHASWAV